MQVITRLYKQHDADLVALFDAGYPVSKMMRDAVVGYAHGTPVHYYIDKFKEFTIGDKTSIKLYYNVPKKDSKTTYLLTHIKKRYRNAFSKMCLRNALVQQNIPCFFTDESLVALQQFNLAGIDLRMYPSLSLCSSMDQSGAEKSMLDGNVKVKMPERRVIDQGQNPYANMDVPPAVPGMMQMPPQAFQMPFMQLPQGQIPVQYMQALQSLMGNAQQMMSLAGVNENAGAQIPVTPVQTAPNIQEVSPAAKTVAQAPVNTTPTAPPEPVNIPAVEVAPQETDSTVNPAGSENTASAPQENNNASENADAQKDIPLASAEEQAEIANKLMALMDDES